MCVNETRSRLLNMEKQSSNNIGKRSCKHAIMHVSVARNNNEKLLLEQSLFGHTN